MNARQSQRYLAIFVDQVLVLLARGFEQLGAAMLRIRIIR
jgi:hypothetical protein